MKILIFMPCTQLNWINYANALRAMKVFWWRFNWQHAQQPYQLSEALNRRKFMWTHTNHSTINIRWKTVLLNFIDIYFRVYFHKQQIFANLFQSECKSCAHCTFIGFICTMRNTMYGSQREVTCSFFIQLVICAA